MADNQRCAHEGCNCEAREGSRYCSDACENAGDQAGCNCGHRDCS